MKRKAYDGIYNQYIKRGIDFCLALVGLIIAAIPMAIVAVAIKAESKGPVIFKQDRIGYKGKVYKMYKFRSMCVGAEKGGVYSDNKDSRVTKVGKFIRATSIDELPQLVNVLNGAAPGGVLEHPGTIKDPQRVRESWQSTFGGSGNSNKIAVLEEGMKYTPIGISPEQAQFLETRKFQINEIARIFRVPPHMVGDLEKSSFQT